ncbi:hypothetical protein AACH06_21805 [Ideonella sp. DXS29W]|uniref:Uncharacterized protein n=1 Tax=Ideonella lacteola TaxID=2984193 RepID=A0ABU9BWG7_9BURK
MRLIIDAKDGVSYLADAALIDDARAGAPSLCEGLASIAARPSFSEVASGTYRFARLREFPVDPAVQREFGPHGLLFDPVAEAAGGEPLLVHGGDVGMPGQRRAALGSVRLEPGLLRALVAQVQRLGLSAARAQLLLELRVGEKPPAWKFWARPSTTRQIVEQDDDDVDFFDAVVPSLAPYRHPNSAHAWMLYFDHQQREADRAQRDAGRSHANHDDHDDSDDDHPVQLAMPEAPCAGDGPQGPVASIVPAAGDVGGLAGPAPFVSTVAPLFQFSPPPGVDAQGRVREVPPPTQTVKPDAPTDASSDRERDASLRAAGLTLSMLAAESLEANPLDAPAIDAAGCEAGAAMIDSAPESGEPADDLVQSSTSY